VAYLPLCPGQVHVDLTVLPHSSVVVLEESPCPRLEDPRGPIFKSSSLSLRSLTTTLVLKDVLVEYNVVKLELEYTRRCVYHTEDHLVTLEKDRLELETAIKHRLELVAAQRQKLTALRRNAESERMRISMELKDRLGRLDRLRSR